MRQAGFLAAAGIYALDHHIERLGVDHLHAASLAEALGRQNYVAAVLPVETNIVIFKVAKGFKAPVILQKFADKGILCSTMGGDTVRLVTHLDVSPEMIDKTIEVIKSLDHE